ncbi:MAG TPA: glycosyltransferase family 4 protein [Bacteroidota bacterium]|nr:glycosyltransferase family 4 protein [Bacteroidota bacterium]
MKKKIALVRGPNLNNWEMQNFNPLRDEFELVGFTSYGHNFRVSEIPFEVKKLLSVGQTLRARALRSIMSAFVGDYHDLVGLGRALKDFDVVHSAETAYYCTYQAAQVRANERWKLVVTVWENIPFLYHAPRMLRNKRKIFSNADLFLATSNRAREVLILEGAPEEKVHVQFPGVDTNHFAPRKRQTDLLGGFGCQPDDTIVLFVGNLSKQKGVFDLLYAFHHVLRQTGPSKRMRLLIAGKGPEHDAMKRLIGNLRIEPYVTFLGSRSYSEMPAIHNLADIFVLPSIPVPRWQEQFGYVLVESMACGKAVISTTSGSIPEVVGKAGVLVAPNDFVSLGHAIAELAGDRNKLARLGKRARSRVQTLFNAQHVSEQMRGHYQSVLAR